MSIHCQPPGPIGARAVQVYPYETERRRIHTFSGIRRREQDVLSLNYLVATFLAPAIVIVPAFLDRIKVGSAVRDATLG